MDIFPPYLFQEVLTDFMSSGHFVRHIRRMRTLYKSRREALVESLDKELGGLVEIHGSEAGMHLSVTLPDGYDDNEIAARAAKEKLWLWPLSPCWTGPGARSGFILGYGNTPAEQMRSEAGRLRKLVCA